MVPRIVVRDGFAHHSVCPFCGRMHKDFSLFGAVLSLIFTPWGLALSAIVLLLAFLVGVL